MTKAVTIRTRQYIRIITKMILSSIIIRVII